jgi:hypothetical protein
MFKYRRRNIISYLSASPSKLLLLVTHHCQSGLLKCGGTSGPINVVKRRQVSPVVRCLHTYNAGLSNYVLSLNEIELVVSTTEYELSCRRPD